MKQENIKLIKEYLVRFAGTYATLATDQKEKLEQLEAKLKNRDDAETEFELLEVMFEKDCLAGYEKHYAQHLEALAELEELETHAE